MTWAAVLAKRLEEQKEDVAFAKKWRPCVFSSFDFFDATQKFTITFKVSEKAMKYFYGDVKTLLHEELEASLRATHE